MITILWNCFQNSPGGLFVLRVSATDADLGNNAKIIYTLEGNYGHHCLLKNPLQRTPRIALNRQS